MGLNNIQSGSGYSTLQSYTGQSAISGSGLGKTFLDTFRSVGSTALGLAGNAAMGSLPADNMSLIQLQQEMNRENLTMTMVSNVEKTKHETKMAPVRNIRVG
ncbi:MAG: hypothetical protein IT292_07685 [Deltaproteobacteria bacterium]|nr:hypothetical protein [Deltaproteobacteria bacterium]